MRLHLQKDFFKDREQLILQEGCLSVYTFRYSTGIEALRVENDCGYFVILPFQGQQIWDFCFGGRNLKMKTTIKEPRKTKVYLETYGGFLYHCGIGSIGAPDESHPHHGEIPNAEYEEAYIDCGCDERGVYVSVGGVLAYDAAFVKKYRFMPECRLYAGASTVHVNVTIENGRAEPLEYLYLCHINFHPINGAKLIYNVPRDANHVKVHKVVPDTLPAAAQEKLRSYMELLEKDPAHMDNVGNPEEAYAPEICFTMTYKPDENGRGYTMQYAEGEGACYVDHPADVLPYGIRWISRTVTEDSMGMILPATAEHLGYKDSKAKGYIRYLGGFEKVSFGLELGYISDARAKQVEEKIQAILDK